MGEQRDRWQFQYVVDALPGTRRLPEMGEDAYLEAESKNLPVGTAIPTVDSALAPTTIEVTGPFVSLRWRTPDDLPELDFEFDGRIAVVRSDRRFPRGLADGELVASYTGADPDTVSVLVDMDVTPQKMWYYTVFFGDAVTTNMTFSPVFGHARVLALSNDAEGSVPVSRLGERAYDLLPTWFRKLDTENDLTLYRLCQVFGRMMDEFWDELAFHRDTMFDLDRVDAARLPYIDWMVGWPTNFELSESHRRRETAEAVGFWKRKGTKGALIALIELLTGFEAEVYEGWRWVAVTGGEEVFDPLVEPAGWDSGTDGVWAELVSKTPLQATFDSTNPDLPRNIGAFNDLLVYTPSTETIPGAVGVPWRHQNMNGLLVVLRPVAAVTGAVTRTLTRKVARFLPMFLGHSYAVGLLVSSRDLEKDTLYAEDEYVGFAVSVARDEGLEFDLTHESIVPEFGTFHVFPHPEFPVMCRIGSDDFRASSSVVHWSGERLRKQLASVTSGNTRLGLVQ